MDKDTFKEQLIHSSFRMPEYYYSFLDFMEKIESNGFTLHYLGVSRIDISYKEYGICSFSLRPLEGISEPFLVVCLKKWMEKDETSKPIQDHKKYFNKFWSENCQNKGVVYAVDPYLYNTPNVLPLQKLLDVLLQIKAVFIDDVVVDFSIEKLSFKDFRCFTNEEFRFNKQSTVFIGKNGVGKTSILDAITIAIGGFLAGINETTDTKAISRKDIRFSPSLKEEEGFSLHYHPPTVVNIESTLVHEKYQWSRTLASEQSTKTTSKDANVITNVVHQLVEDMRDEKVKRRIVLPVFSFHGVGRAGNFARDMGLLERMEQISRFFGYKDCLKAASNYKMFVAWYRKMKYRAFETQKRIPTLEAVTTCIVDGLQLLTKDEERRVTNVLYYDGLIHVQYADGDVVPVSYLSDGWQTVIGIISDIAMRMAILNPQLGDAVTKHTPGIVLIDEIELHLHPSWQQKILHVLKTLFPNVQFIATTHSPLIISTTQLNEAVELVRTDNGMEATFVGNPKDWYFADILEQVFHVPKKPLYVEQTEGASLDDKLINFNKAVQEYLLSPKTGLKETIDRLYSELLPSLPESSPKRRAIDTLKEMVDHETTPEN